MASVKGIDPLQRRLAAIGDTRQMLGTLAVAAVREAEILVPRRTGNLGRTIRVGRVDGERAEVIAGGQNEIGYAAAVEFGTKPHIIRPRPGRIGRNGRPAALAWGGKRTLAGKLRKGAKPEFFARSVRHPGSRAKPYLRPGIARALQRGGIKARIIDSWNRAA